MKLIVKENGSKLLMLGDDGFTVHWTKKMGDDCVKTRWFCRKRHSGCKAYLYTINNVPFDLRTVKHNH
ncbi:unnamed protein product [Colias eurytheme]|nr:unnamed protein product [Colias eurytheme]